MNKEYIIENEDQLRSLYPSTRYLPVLDQLDRSCRLFIERSPMVVIGAYSSATGLEVSPRGDAPGFVRVFNERTLMIPDRSGNNRLDCMTAILANKNIGLFFVIPGVTESLRIKGQATITHDPELLKTAEAQGKLPKAAILVDVQEAFIHCGKALTRSRIWEDDYKSDAHSWRLARATLENSLASHIEL